VSEVVRFDEHENPLANAAPAQPVSPVTTPGAVSLPETSSTPTTATNVFPAMNFPSGDTAGWMYLNLNNGGSLNFSAAGNGVANIPGFAVNGTIVRPSQNWVIISMFAQGRYSVDFDAAWLGNGCSAPAAISTATAGGTGTIGPAGGFVSAVRNVPFGAGGPLANVTP
jgi:hypothetical protein